jgi:hypothetical protein
MGGILAAGRQEQEEGKGKKAKQHGSPVSRVSSGDACEPWHHHGKAGHAFQRVKPKPM